MESFPSPFEEPCVARFRCLSLPGWRSHRWSRSVPPRPCPEPPRPGPAGHKAQGRLQKEASPQTDPPPAPPDDPLCFRPSDRARQRLLQPTHPSLFLRPHKTPGCPRLWPRLAGSDRGVEFPDKTHSPTGCPHMPDRTPVLPPPSAPPRSCHSVKCLPPPRESGSASVYRLPPAHRVVRNEANP